MDGETTLANTPGAAALTGAAAKAVAASIAPAARADIVVRVILDMALLHNIAFAFKLARSSEDVT